MITAKNYLEVYIYEKWNAKVSWWSDPIEA